LVLENLSREVSWFKLVMNIYHVFDDEKDLHDVIQYGGHKGAGEKK
jgi:hypothetical protein